MDFSATENAVAFAYVSGKRGITLFETLLSGSVVDSFSVTSDSTNTNNFIGFAGESFDAIRISPPDPHGAFIDNVQFGSTTTPEPGTFVLVGGSLLAAAGIARRRKT